MAQVKGAVGLEGCGAISQRLERHFACYSHVRPFWTSSSQRAIVHVRDDATPTTHPTTALSRVAGLGACGIP
jgi:hypothetical protein